MNIFSIVPNCQARHSRRRQRLLSAPACAVLCGLLIVVAAGAGAQTGAASPAVVQPGAPGQPSTNLPASTSASLPPPSPADAEFMRGMIMHHAQAIEMTALISSHTENKALRSLGARISSSQLDEIRFMKRWLAARGEPPRMEMPPMQGMDMAHHPMTLMPGMLTPEQMEALRKAGNAGFDR